MATLNPHTTRGAGTVLTANIYNNDHENHINNATAINTEIGTYGTVVTEDTGSSGHTLPFLDGANTWSASQTLTAGADALIAKSANSGAGPAFLRFRDTDDTNIGYVGLGSSANDDLNLSRNTTGTININPTAGGTVNLQGSVELDNDLPVSEGGTGASNSADARANLGATGNFVSMSVITSSDPSRSFGANTKLAVIYICGGGGGTPNSGSTASNQATAVSGGGAGGEVWHIVDVESLTTPEANITIGSGGSVGSDGGDSTYVDDNDTLTASGGSAGVAGGVSTGIRDADAGQGGDATGGNRIGVRGNHGGAAMSFGASALSSSETGWRSGKGADSTYGRGGTERSFGDSTASTISGQGGQGFGAGASGGGSSNGGGAGSGAAGAPGVCIIWEYR